MNQIWVKQFSGGLDSRRMPETTLGGALLRATDCHINRGGELEQRAAFVDLATLPAGTVGLAYDTESLVVFGSGAEPAGMPAGVRYQQLVHPDNPSATLTGVPSFDRMAKKLYVVGEFDDGTRVHFYDGEAVDWPFDGRARASILLSGSGQTPGTAATATFTITATGASGSYYIDQLFAGSDQITPDVVSDSGNYTRFIGMFVDSCNNYVGSPDFSVSYVMTTNLIATITVTAADVGVWANGAAINYGAKSANLTFSAASMAGGVDVIYGALNTLAAGGVSLIGGAVESTTDDTALAAAVAAAVNAKTSVTGVSAKSTAGRVTLRYETAGTANNDVEITTSVTAPVVVSPSSGAFFSGGLDVADRREPGRYVKAMNSKMYVGAEEFLVFSGIDEPTRMTTDVTGAGFIDFSGESADVSDIRAIVPYQSYGAVFDERVILIWFFDPDPTLNRKAQVLENTGTTCPRSVTQIGDSDLLYLDRSGVRSIRARSGTQSAATTDVGVPVDSLIQDSYEALTADERLKVFGLIEPRDGRFWLVMKDEIYVFTTFPGSKIAAWSRYLPTVDVNGVQTLHSVDEAVRFQGKIYLRSEDEIIVYGGTGDTLTYDATEPEIWLPYLDAEKPALPKMLSAIDIACEGLWKVSVAADPTNTATEDPAVIIGQSSFNSAAIPYEVSGTHFSLRLRGVAGESGPRKVGSACLHYTANDSSEQR